MKNEILQSVTGFLKAHRCQKRWQRVVTCLAAVVVFCTTYALILPAITMTDNNQVLECSLNIHEHTADCYDSEHNLICGEANFVVHTHNDDCYDTEGNLICKLPEIKAHEHTADCYKQEKMLTCTQEEGHQHTADCYSRERGTLICTNVDPDHEHTDDCYEWIDVLTCGQEEGGHIHTDDCYEIQNILICDNPAVLHKHTDDCYDADGKLICGQMEVLEHVHGNGCFVEAEQEEPTPEETQPAEEFFDEEITEPEETELPEDAEYPEEETPADDSISTPYSGDKNAGVYLVPTESASSGIRKAMARALAETAPESVSEPVPLSDESDSVNNVDLTSHITGVTIKRRDNAEADWENVNADGNVRAGDQLRFEINYELSEGTLNTERHVVIYQIPTPPIKITEEKSGTVYDDTTGEEAGSYKIDTNGMITIDFLPSYAGKNDGEGASKIKGYITIESSVSDMQNGDDTEITIPFEKDYTLHVKNTEGDLKVEKISQNVQTTLGTLDYKIKVSSENGTSDVVTLKETPDQVAMIKDTLTIDPAVGEGYGLLEDGTIKLPQMAGEDTYTITYSAKITETLTGNNFVTATNMVTASSKDSAGIKITDTATRKDIFTKALITKSGVSDTENPGWVIWTVRLNYALTKVDISGWTLTDMLGGAPYTGDVTITPNPETGSDSKVVTLGANGYTFPDNSPVVEYTVTYRTKSSITTVNTAVLTPPGLDQSGGVDFSAIPGDYSITKKFNSYSAIENTDENTEGHCLLNMNWTMTVDASNGAIPANIQSGDLLGKTWKKWPNQGRWYVYDQPKNDTNLVHYFTASQLETAAENIAVAIDGTSYTGEYYIFASKGFGSTNLNNNPEDAALIKRSDRYTDSGNAYWDEKYMKTLDENAKYGRFYIYFDRDFPEGESFRFDYSTTADVIDGTVSTDLRNEARIMVHNAYRGGQDGQKYNPAARKYDKRNSLLDDTDPKKVPVGTTTSYHYGTSELDYSDSAGTGTNVLSWAIDINLPDYLYYTSNVVITETLPKGLELLQYTVKDSNPPRTNHQYGLFAKLPGFDGSMFYFDEEAVKPTMYSNGAMVIDKDTCTMTKGAYTITAKRISDTEYRIIIPPDMANNIKGKKGTVTVNAHIKDDTEWTGIERDFTNNVTVSTAGDLLGESSHTQVVRRPVIVKESGEINNNTIPYTITINESRDDLVPGYDTLTLTDVLSYKQSSTDNVNAMLDYSSVHVYELDVDGSTIGEITSDCPYTLAEGTSSDGQVTRTIKMTIPDGKALKVEYSYKMSGSGKVSDLSNTATVSGIDSGSDSSNKELEMEIDNTSFGVTLSGVSVYKKDSQNFSLILKGAEFKLEKYNKNNSTWETVQDSNGNDLSCTTGENGMFKIENVDNNTAYRLTETKEPTIAGGNTKDYVLDPTPYYFYIVDNSAPECMPTGFSSGTYVENEITYKVSAVNPGDSITISNRPVGYELPETGGIGTTLYTIGGLVIAGMGVSLLYKNKKCRKEDFASS